MSQDKVSLPGRYCGYTPTVANGYRKDAQYVAVRDGCRLAVDVYRPTHDGKTFETPFPTIVISTGYRRSFLLKEGEFAAGDYKDFEVGDCVSAVTRAARLIDRHMARWHEAIDHLDAHEFRAWLIERASTAEFILMHGYNVVIVDNRATGASFGGSDGLDHQTQGMDVVDLFDWIVAQPWSTDSIGMMGSSWLGLAQNATISCTPRHLKCVIPVNAGADTFVPMYPGGLYNVGLMRQWYSQRDMFERGFEADVVDEDPDGVLREEAIAERRALSDDPPWILTIPTADEREALLDRYASWSRERYQANSRYYDRVLPDETRGDWAMGHLDPRFANRTDVAYYGYGGFWDLCGYTMAMAFADLTVPRKLLIGPWHHGNWRRSEQEEHLRWFDHHLKAVDNGIMDEPPVVYATSHPVEPPRWFSATQFPPKGAVPKVFHGGKRAALSGTLSEHEDDSDARFSMMVDYDVSTGLANRNWGHNVTDFLHLDDLEKSRDVLITLLSQPLDAELEITGFPVVELSVALNAEAGAVFVYLQDIAPDGMAYYLSEGQLNLRDRKVSSPPFDYLGLPYHSIGENDRLAVVPGESMTLEIAMHSVSWRVPAGHRLCLTVTGADQANAYQRVQTPAPVLSVLCGPSEPLRLTLPVMQPGAATDTRIVAGAFANIKPASIRAMRPTQTSLLG